MCHPGLGQVKVSITTYLATDFRVEGSVAAVKPDLFGGVSVSLAVQLTVTCAHTGSTRPAAPARRVSRRSPTLTTLHLTAPH